MRILWMIVFGRLMKYLPQIENIKWIAFIFHFINISNDEILNYNGGTGVMSSYKSQHLSSERDVSILPKLVQCKVDKMRLEVLTENFHAIKTYQNKGFKIIKELNYF